MKLVFQVRLTPQEAAAMVKDPALLEELTIITAVTLETAQRTANKPITAEIFNEATGEVLRKLP